MSEPKTHHTAAQIRAAFVRAFAVLKELEAAGAQTPSIELFSDGSGRLHLHLGEDLISQHLHDVAIELLHSECWVRTEQMALHFGDGLLTADPSKFLDPWHRRRRGEKLR